MAWFRNYYKCVECGRKWTDLWTATCDDDCPHCGSRHMSPYKSADAVRLEEESTVQSTEAAVGSEEDVDDEPAPALFINYYICENCDHTWSEIWSAMCDDDCPHCGSRHMSPFKSEEVSAEEEDADSDQA